MGSSSLHLEHRKEVFLIHFINYCYLELFLFKVFTTDNLKSSGEINMALKWQGSHIVMGSG